jgi:predicted SnoaL-like aldol condensation-catalyzing enzyme
MKKFMILAVAASAVMVSCSDKTAGTSKKTQANLDNFNTISNAFETGDTSMIDSLVAADFVSHGEVKDDGRDSLKAMIRMAHEMDSTMKSEPIKVFADDDYVIGWMKFTGTSNGTWMPPGPYEMTSIEVVRFKDGKAVEHWVYMDPREMMKMMQGQTMPADTTRKMGDN